MILSFTALAVVCIPREILRLQEMIKPVDRLQKCRFGHKLIFRVRQVSLEPESVLNITVHRHGILIARLL